ncbi:unnamed protein product [Closterium sp. NIES-64]|nr:unnamed protein product [Closterium sp. NIES-64]
MQSVRASPRPRACASKKPPDSMPLLRLPLGLSPSAWPQGGKRQLGRDDTGDDKRLDLSMPGLSSQQGGGSGGSDGPCWKKRAVGGVSPGVAAVAVSSGIPSPPRMHRPGCTILGIICSNSNSRRVYLCRLPVLFLRPPLRLPSHFASPPPSASTPLCASPADLPRPLRRFLAVTPFQSPPEPRITARHPFLSQPSNSPLGLSLPPSSTSPSPHAARAHAGRECANYAPVAEGTGGARSAQEKDQMAEPRFGQGNGQGNGQANGQENGQGNGQLPMLRQDPPQAPLLHVVMGKVVTTMVDKYGGGMGNWARGVGANQGALGSGGSGGGGGSSGEAGEVELLGIGAGWGVGGGAANGGNWGNGETKNGCRGRGCCGCR